MTSSEKYPYRPSSEFPPLLNDRFFKAVRGESVDKVPVWIMRQAGRYLPGTTHSLWIAGVYSLTESNIHTIHVEFRKSREKADFFTLCRTPALVAEVTLQPIDRYEGLLDASIIFCDILVICQAMGMTVEMLPGKGPHFPQPLVEPSDLARLKRIEDLNLDEELGYVYEGITLTRQELKGRVPLFGFIGSPWTLMAYMIEGGGSKTLSKAKTWLFKYPEASHQLLQMITDVAVEFLIGQVKAGAQMLQVFDSWGGELSPSEFEEFSFPYLKQIVTRVKKQLDTVSPSLSSTIPMAVFARGSHYALESLSVSGYDIMSLDWTVDPAQARKRTAGSSITLQGNADPSLLYGDKERIYAHVKKMLGGFGTTQYIANLGHGMYPDHDPEHLKWYLEAIRDVSHSMNK